MDQGGRGLVYANGLQTTFAIKLPARPQEVELDPELWVLSEKTVLSKAK